MKLWNRGVQGAVGQSSSVARNSCFDADFFMAHFFFLPVKRSGRTRYGRRVLNGDEGKSEGGLLFNHAFKGELIQAENRRCSKPERLTNWQRVSRAKN